VAEPAGALGRALRERRLDPTDPRVDLAVGLYLDAGVPLEALADEVEALLRREPRAAGPAWGPAAAIAPRAIAASIAAVGEAPDLDARGAATALGRAARLAGLRPGALAHVVRLALTGRSRGPDLARLVAVLGRDETLRRLGAAVAGESGGPAPVPRP